MIVTKLKPPKLSENMITAFGGINKNPNCPENFFTDTQNTSAALFPLLSTREKRAKLTTFDSKPTALHTVNGITLVIDRNLIYNGVLQFDNLSENTNKQLVSMGSLVIVFPDGYYINTLSADEIGVCSDKGFLGQKNSITDKHVGCFPCLSDSIPTVSNDAPTSPKNNDLWFNTFYYPNVLNIYSETNKGWVAIAPTHICIKVDGISDGLNIGDTIEISGASDDINGMNTIVSMGDNYIIVSGMLEIYKGFNTTSNTPFTVERSIPLLDFVCEHQNRLFGCRYGKNNKGEFVNEIYSSKLGDPKNWNSFSGLSTDSYVASCGSEGKWTGIISHMGYVVFFKENKIHRLFGTKPSNFNLYQDEYPGVKAGSEKSLCILNGTLYYHSEHGIYSYTGSSPTCVSSAFGEERFSDAVGCIYKNTYYVCMKDKNNQSSLFTYDTEKQLWHREDNSDYYIMSAYDGNILGIKKTKNEYALDVLKSSQIPEFCKTLYCNTTEYENALDWYVISGKIGLSIDECKFINRIKIRLEADLTSAVSVYIQLDSNGIWEDCGSITSNKLSPCSFDIIPPRCDHFHIKITGNGHCKIYSITKIIEHASEVV